MGKIRRCDTIEQYAKEHGLSHTTAYRRLREKGLYPIPLITLPSEEITQLYCQSGLSARDIAALFFCDRDTVIRNLKLNGVPIRTHSQAMKLAGEQKKTARFKNEHPNWRGGLIISEGYYKAHRWIKERCGKADRCQINPTHNSTLYDWANISRNYLCDTEDWIMLCHACHYWFDHPGIPKEIEQQLLPEALKAYLEGRRRRNGENPSL